MAMEKLKKRFNTSPIIKKKTTTVNGCPSTSSAVRGDGHLKTFGASLEELALRERCDIPLIVKKICEYVLERGLCLEGLFRVNGNVRLIQSLMTTYEAEGDVDLGQCDDVHSVAGLLKRFVRDLSDGLIPERLTADFIKAVEAHGESEDACLAEIRHLLECLSQESYATLRYLCYFLWEVCQKEAENKMSAGSLGIVFGPNVFRCGENWINLGLSMSYTHCNRAMSLMISNCHRIFEKPETSGALPNQLAVPSTVPGVSAQKTPPPRPPPPRLPSPSESPPRLFLQTTWGKTPSDEHESLNRSSSPFLQDNSETECSLSRDIGPPAPSVSNVIHYVISDSIFGETDNEPSCPPSPKPRKPRTRCRSVPFTPETFSPSQTNGESSDHLQTNGKAATEHNFETETLRHDVTDFTDVPTVLPRRKKRSDGAPSVSSGHSFEVEINNNLQWSHSLPELKINTNEPCTPSDGEQSLAEVTARNTGESDEDRSLVSVQEVRRQIQALKRNVRRFEEEFAKENGHKPSVSEKNANKQVRNYLSDLAACRRRLKARQDGSDDSEPLKLMARSRSVDHMHMNGSRDSVSPPPSSRTPRPQRRKKSKIPLGPDMRDGVMNEPANADAGEPKNGLQRALEELEHELQVKRELSGRPQPLVEMSLDQIREEKITLQRGLLNHESKYGRPKTLEEKEVMRPVYDRYRTVKRVLAGARRGEGPTDVMVQSAMAGVTSNQSIDGNLTANGDLFAVTQDFQARMRREGLMTASLVNNPPGGATASVAGVQRRNNGRGVRTANHDKRRSQPVMPSESIASIEHLKEEEGRLLLEKKKLQRILKQYERNFEQETGRKLERADRKPMQNEYLRYKNLKIKLKDLTNAISMNS